MTEENKPDSVLEPRDIRHLEVSQIPFARIGEWILAIAIIVFVVVGILNLGRAHELALEQDTTIMTIFNTGFQQDASIPGMHLYTLERINSGFLQILTGGLLAILLRVNVVVRHRNKRILAFVKNHAPDLPS